jgi:hypothetical protein
VPRSEIKSASLEKSQIGSGKNKLYPKRAKQDSASVSTKPDQFLNSLISSVSWSPEWIQEAHAWVGHMPFAYWLMTEWQPKIFVELGTHTGNSYFSFCEAVPDKGLVTRCYAVDTWKGDEQAGFYGDHVFELVNRHNESQYKSFSTLYRMTFDEALAKFQDQSVDLLHIDGLHTYEAVRHDFETWLPKLARGALVLFHDIKVTHGDFGVWKFWAELKEKYPQNFEFRHSHGLGVIQLPESTRRGNLVWLREGTAEKKNLLEVMSANGESLMAKVRHQELERLASAAQTKANKPAIEKPLNLELFFAQEGEMFSEKKKMSEPVTCRENEHSQIRIQLQGKATRSVLWRIDLGDKPGLFRVHELGFTCENGKKIWCLTDHSDEALIGGSAERLSDEGFVVCSFGSDPQILLPKLSLSEDKKLYEIRITLEVLNAKDYLPFLATRYHELKSQSRSALAQASEALKRKEKEDTNAQSRVEKFERIEKNISKHIGELKEELAQQQQKSQQENNSTHQSLFKGLIAELKETWKEEAERGRELGRELGYSLAGLKQEMISKLQALESGLDERQRQFIQKNRAEVDVLKTSLENSSKTIQDNLEEVARYAEQIQDSVIAPSSYLLPAPFSWYSYLYKMLHIKKPYWLKEQKMEKRKRTNRPGFWRRLEQSIRKRRKRLLGAIGFDRLWYLAEYPDVKNARCDALEHYLNFGTIEKRFKSKKDKELKTKKESVGCGQTTYLNLQHKSSVFNYASTPTEIELKEFGYTFLGPALALLFQEINKNLSETTVPIFLAREGFALKNIYSELVKKNLLLYKPFPVYLKVSRQVLYKRILLRPDLNKIIWKSYEGKTNLKEFLMHKCLIDETFLNQKIPREALKASYDLPKEIDKLNEAISKNSKELNIAIKEDNENIDLYLKTFGLNKDHRSPLFIDIGYSGTAQKILSSILNIPSKGVYLITTGKEKEKVNNNELEIIGALKNNVQFSSGYVPLQRSLLLEALLTADTGQVVKVLKTPNECFDFIYGITTTNQSLFHLCKTIQLGAQQCVIDCFKNQLNWEKHQVEKILETNLRQKLIPKSLCQLFEIDDMFHSRSVLNSFEIFT